jgi:succinylglutamate desuccinylase
MGSAMSGLELQQIDFIPEGLLHCSSLTLNEVVNQPNLIHLEGKQAQPLFISVLLHGNEPTGLLAVQKLLNKYQDRELPRSLSLFFGNIQAASQGMRRLDDQADYNRI